MYNVEYKSHHIFICELEKSQSQEHTNTNSLEFTQDCIRTCMQANFTQSLQDLSLRF